MNNPFVLAQAAAFAGRLIACSNEPCARIRLAYESAWGRPPETAEIERVLEFLRAYRAALAESGASLESREREAWASLAKVLLTANEFLYID
jgi:hypothetical protein